jgi:hypothetical protein
METIISLNRAIEFDYRGLKAIRRIWKRMES